MAYQSDNITISNVTMVNVVGANTDVYSFIYVTNLNTGFISINGLYMYNSSFDQHDGIFIDNYSSSKPSYLTLTNCIYSNIVMKSNTVLIRTSVMKNLNLSSISFNNVTQTDPSNSSNNMINIGGMDFNTTGSFSIDQLHATNSSISMLNIGNIINTNITNNQTLTMSNSGYSNSTIQYSDNIINLKNIEIDSTLQLQIFNISMSGITFIRGGNLILFQQQTKSPMIVTNSLFQNIYGGGIQFEAYNKNNLTLITSISFINMTVTNFSGNTQSFLTATTGSAISVYNSLFANNCNYMNGAVASSDAQSASISFYNSTFQNNTAVKGAVFNVDNQGYISWSNCTLKNNFAIQSGVIQASNDGYFGIYSSVVSDNYAYTIPIGEMFLASVTSIVSNWTISNNVVFSSDYIISQLTKCDLLWFMLSDFKTFISQNTQLVNTASTQYGFQLISGSLQFDNTTLIQNQNYFVSSFQSSLSLINVTIQNCISYINIISISYSSLSATNLMLTNITKSTSSSQVISALFESSISMNSLKYTSSNTVLINVYSASLTISNIDISLLSIENYLISLSNWYNITIQNWSISSINSTSESIIYSLTSSINLLQNLSMSNINTAGLILDQSNATNILMLSLLSMDKGIIIKSNSIIFNMYNSTFAQLGSSNLLYGGAIDVTDSIINITNWDFEQNQAMSGAAISIRWSSNKNWENRYDKTNFNSNKAEQQGGAIYYSFKRPNLTNCTFNGNSAPYGSIIASYPVKITEKISLNTSIIYDNVPSGIKMNSPLVFALQDYDGQTIHDSIYQVKINAVSSNASTAGYNSAKATSGVATFNNLIFVSSPGAQHVTFKATSNAIDVTKNTALNMSTFSSIDVSFRFWMPGEAQISSSLCQTWAPGTFSFTWNSTAWQNWLSNTVWAGGTDIEVNPEYWRISTNSTTILDCPFPAAWLGGYYPDSKYPVKWTTGYKSYLWSEWDIVDGEKYVKTSGDQCSKWSIPLVNALKFWGLIILSFAFLTILIVILIRKKRENQTSILMRIMTNYVQLIAVSMTFKVKFPVSLTQLFGPINLFGSTSDTYLSYDWFISGIQVTAFTPSVQLFKIVLTGFMPIGLFLLYLAIWGCLYFAMNKWFSSIKRNLIISAICIIFMFHPTIMKSCLQIFECTLVNENDKRMDLYMDYKWYSKEHFFWIGTVAIPILVVWVIGAPVLALLILFRHRKHLEQGYIKEYMLILYQGLKPNAFYWEFVNTLRKGLVLWCSVFLSTESPIYQTLCSVIILIVIMRLQQFIKPYKNSINNDLEQNAINAWIVTLFCGIVFSQTQTNYDIFNTIALSFLIIVNSIFIIEWVFFLLLSLNFKHEKFRALLKIYAFIILKKKFLENYRTQESTSTVMQPSSSKPEHKSIIKKVNIKNKSKKYKVAVKKVWWYA